MRTEVDEFGAARRIIVANSFEREWIMKKTLTTVAGVMLLATLSFGSNANAHGYNGYGPRPYYGPAVVIRPPVFVAPAYVGPVYRPPVYVSPPVYVAPPVYGWGRPHHHHGGWGRY
jgi:hypothetical protein